ncbi:sigma-70 family RNA polymerase sigma factor [Pseudothauera nasutitermitis]|uniref:Sigma-70 family RNA polymerase sigma factor n=1 Tax=Pseudothauera nasutitermitis TaxID=2565930 RepID=A0A4S4AZ87_9RHOO|nr:sigma-70 family RNA polymerase sigma factor [Pseudothauera nasutitermitis]THF65490.1 sigma-70 family RNA polymerase sigma factor [Pseudothauera nasutitermitis]
MSARSTQSRFDVFYRDNHAWLQRWLRKKVNCPDNAADLAHDAFVRILAMRTQRALEESRALLVTVAKGLVVDQYRRRTLEQAYLDVLARMPEHEQPSEEARLIVRETLIEVDRMLDGLCANARRAFLLSQVDGLGYAEIAAELGLSVSAVQKYMVRAMQAYYRVTYAAGLPASDAG